MLALAVIILSGFSFGELPFCACGPDKGLGEVEIPSFVFLTKTTPSSIVCENLCLYSSRCDSCRWDRSTRNCQLYSHDFHKALWQEEFEARRSKGDNLMRKLQGTVKIVSHVCSSCPCVDHEMCVPLEAGRAYLCLIVLDNAAIVSLEAANPHNATYTSSAASSVMASMSTFLTTSFSVHVTSNIRSLVTETNTLYTALTATTSPATPYVTTSPVSTVTAVSVKTHFTPHFVRATITSTISSPATESTAQPTLQRTAVSSTTSYPKSTITIDTDVPSSTVTLRTFESGLASGNTTSAVAAATTARTFTAITTTSPVTYKLESTSRNSNAIVAIATTTAITTTTAISALVTYTATANIKTVVSPTTTLNVHTFITTGATVAARTTTCTPTVPLPQCLPQTKKRKVQRSYVGCYQDSPCRILPYVPCQHKHMTIYMCYSHCLGRNYSYYGIEVGHECFCGDVILEDFIKVPQWQCCSRCEGGRGFRCGGDWRISVFKT